MTPTDSRPVAIYVRVSGTGQYGNASYGDPKAKNGAVVIGYQEQDCRREIERRGLKVSDEHIFREVCSGQAVLSQPSLLALLDRVATGEFQAVFCFSTDRMTRDSRAGWDYIRQSFRIGNAELVLLDKPSEAVDEFVDSFRSLSVRMFREAATGILSDEDLDAIALRMRLVP